MSVVGFDFGNLNTVAAVARKRGIDVIANEASRRETATLVGFRDDQRTMGELASAQLTSNLNNTVNNFKKLLGKKWNDPQVQSELASAFYRSKEIEGGEIGVEVDYQGSMQTFTPEQITAMMLTQMRKTVEKDSNNQIKMQELVISVPSHFSDAERRALKDASAIAGLNCVQLLSEPLAVAIPWGMYRKDLPEDDKALKVMFVNFGESSLWCAVASVSKSKLSIQSVASDPNLGGRDFDRALATHFSEIIKEQYKIDVSTNKRAIQRLKTQCERVKKVLTTGPEAPLFVESIMNDIDVRSHIKRDEFEKICSDLVERAATVAQKAMEDASVDSLDFVEVVGGSSYVAAFQKRLQEVTKVETLSHTLNKSEAVARGCALQCAIVSPQFHINKTTTIKDYNPYSIKLTWSETQSGGEKTTKSAVLFAKGCALGSAKRVTFQKSSVIEISADYADPSEFPVPIDNLNIAHFTVPQFQPTVESDKTPTVEVMFKLDASGVFVMKYARATEYYTEIVPATKTEKKAEQTPETKPSPSSDDSNGENTTPATDSAASEADTPAVDADGDAVMEEPKKVERKKVSELLVESTFTHGLPAAKLEEYKKQEQAMQNADELAIATAEARNALESYSYDAQGKLQYDFSEWVEFASEEEKTKLLAMVDEVLAWLYGEGDSATRETYQTKLNELQVLGSPIELRKTESEAREPAIQELMEAIKYYKAFVNTKEEKYAHISEEQRQKVTDKINETEDWLNKMTTKQQELPKTADPVLLSSEISNKKEALTLFSNVIVNTPVPKKTEPKKEEAKKEENMQTESTTSEGETTTTDDASKTEGETDLPKAAEDGKIEELDENAVEKPSDDMDVD